MKQLRYFCVALAFLICGSVLFVACDSDDQNKNSGLPTLAECQDNYVKVCRDLNNDLTTYRSALTAGKLSFTVTVVNLHTSETQKYDYYYQTVDGKLNIYITAYNQPITAGSETVYAQEGYPYAKVVDGKVMLPTYTKGEGKVSGVWADSAIAKENITGYFDPNQVSTKFNGLVDGTNDLYYIRNRSWVRDQVSKTWIETNVDNKQDHYLYFYNLDSVGKKSALTNKNDYLLSYGEGTFSARDNNTKFTLTNIQAAERVVVPPVWAATSWEVLLR